jgi:hypothetical protein
VNPKGFIRQKACKEIKSKMRDRLAATEEDLPLPHLIGIEAIPDKWMLKRK